MKKLILNLIGMFVVNISAFAGSWWGYSRPELEIEGGSIVYHLTDIFHKVDRESNYFFKPMALISKNGFVGGYLKNSHSRNSLAFGIRRYWLDKKWHDITYQTGYAVAVMHGYCSAGGLHIYEDCNSETHPQLAPYAQLFFKLRKGNISLNLNYSAVLIYASVSAYFS